MTRQFDRRSPERERFVLRDRSDLDVARAEGQDVSAGNFYPARPDQLDLTPAGKALINGAAAPEKPAAAPGGRRANASRAGPVTSR